MSCIVPKPPFVELREHIPSAVVEPLQLKLSSSMNLECNSWLMQNSTIASTIPQFQKDVEHIVKPRQKQGNKLINIVCGNGENKMKFPPRAINFDYSTSYHEFWFYWLDACRRIYGEHSEKKLRRGTYPWSVYLPENMSLNWNFTQK